MIREVKTIYEHRCDVCQHSVENFDRGETSGREAPLLSLGEVCRGGRVVSRHAHICRECAHKPLIELLNALKLQGAEYEKLLIWESEEVPF